MSSVNFGSNVLGNTSVAVAGTGWYNVSFASVNLALGTQYFLNVYETSGSVMWGYTTVAAATVFLNTGTEYYYVGHSLVTSTITPNLYVVGYTAGDGPELPVLGHNAASHVGGSPSVSILEPSWKVVNLALLARDVA